MATIHALLALDRRCVWGCAVTLASTLRHCDDEARVHFHIVGHGLAGADREALRETVERHRQCASLRFMEFDPSPFLGLQRSSAITRTAYARLALGTMLPEHVSRCIYLDCDLVVQRDIADLWDTDLHSFVLGAVDNGLWDDPRAYQRRLGLAHPSYFNSGVLLVDVDRWRAERVGTRALEFAQKAGDLLILHDQDALNGALDGAWQPLDEGWNLWVVHPSLHWDSDAVFHFMGCPKPWHADYTGPFADKFYWHLDRTPFGGARPWNPMGLGSVAGRLRRKIPYIPSALRMLRSKRRSWSD